MMTEIIHDRRARRLHRKYKQLMHTDVPILTVHHPRPPARPLEERIEPLPEPLPLRPCAEPGCPGKARTGHYCPQHRLTHSVYLRTPQPLPAISDIPQPLPAISDTPQPPPVIPDTLPMTSRMRWAIRRALSDELRRQRCARGMSLAMAGRLLPDVIYPWKFVFNLERYRSSLTLERFVAITAALGVRPVEVVDAAARRAGVSRDVVWEWLADVRAWGKRKKN